MNVITKGRTTEKQSEKGFNIRKATEKSGACVIRQIAEERYEETK